MRSCAHCARAAVALGYRTVGPRHATGMWEPMCAACASELAFKVKALAARDAPSSYGDTMTGAVPPKEPTLTDARVARDEAMQQVDAHADDAWKFHAWTWLLDYLAAHEEFFPDDVWAAGLPVPRERRALGPLVSKAARAGYIVATDKVRARTRGHTTPAMVWRSTLYGKS